MLGVVALFRAVNVGGHNKVSMPALQKLFTSLDLQEAKTFIQSGNVVFKTKAAPGPKLTQRIEAAFEQQFGFRSDVILRTASDLRDVLKRNPFRERTDVLPGRLLITFLAGDPGEEARQAVRQLPVAPEELFVDGREMFVHYPEGMGRTKLPVAKIAKLLGVAGTARNLNTVVKLLAMAEELS